MPRRALGRALLLSLATVVGATVAVGRAPQPVDPVDPALLTRVTVPAPATAAPAPRASTEPTPAAPIRDFPVAPPSFAPRSAPQLEQTVGVIVVPTPTRTPPPAPRPAAPQPVARPGGADSGGDSGGDAGAAPAPVVPSGSNRVSGVASWYCQAGVSACHRDYPGGMYAAAGPALRVGNWRGRTVTVCGGGGCVRVTLVDWCQCYGTRVIDLYSDAYRQLAPLSSGTTAVTVSW